MDDALQQLTALVARLPGLGPRSARRVVLHLMKHRETLMQPLAAALDRVGQALTDCSVCGNLDTADPCRICTDPRRDPASLCVVADVADLWALERGRLFPGRYHVLGGVLSAPDGVGPDDLSIAALFTRLADRSVVEVIIATDPNLEGEATAAYLSRFLKGMDLKVTRLASGLPVGGDLEYADEVTLGRAFEGRTLVHV